MSTPTSRTLDECKKRGWPAYVTEKRIPKINILKDAFGFGDVLAIDGEPGSMLIQATANQGHVAKRVRKITEDCTDNARAWLEAGNRIEVWGWAKRVHKFKNGKKGMRWKLRVVPVTLVDFV